MPKPKLNGYGEHAVKASQKPTSWGPTPNTSTSTNGWNAPSKGTARTPSRSVTTRTGARQGKRLIVSGVPEMAVPGTLSEVTYRPGKGMSNPRGRVLPNIVMTEKQLRHDRETRRGIAAQAKAETLRVAALRAEADATHAEAIAAQTAKRITLERSASRTETGAILRAPQRVSTVLTHAEAQVLYRAAIGAARAAEAAGKADLSAQCTERAREYRRIVRRGDASLTAPVRPAVKDMAQVKATDLPEDVKAITRALMPREWTVVGAPKRCAKRDCRLYARVSGKSIRYALIHVHTEE